MYFFAGKLLFICSQTSSNARFCWNNTLLVVNFSDARYEIQPKPDPFLLLTILLLFFALWTVLLYLGWQWLDPLLSFPLGYDLLMILVFRDSNRARAYRRAEKWITVPSVWLTDLSSRLFLASVPGFDYRRRTPGVKPRTASITTTTIPVRYDCLYFSKKYDSPAQDLHKTIPSRVTSRWLMISSPQDSHETRFPG